METTKYSIESSVFTSVTYAADATLDIEFTSGDRYRYFAVPRSIVVSLLHAESKGAFFNRHIKPRFHAQRLVS